MVRKIVQYSPSSNGVTLPKAFLEILRIEKGDKVDVSLIDEKIVIIKKSKIKKEDDK